jgi:hypothetical protein
VKSAQPTKPALSSQQVLPHNFASVRKALSLLKQIYEGWKIIDRVLLACAVAFAAAETAAPRASPSNMAS